jgi:hypothetical protein
VRVPGSRAVGRRPRIGLAALTVVLALLVLLPAQADAGTVRSVINIPALVITNACNGEEVVVSGQLQLMVTTTPAPGGGEIVRSRAISKGLRGVGLTSGITYRARDAEASLVHQAPAPGPSQFLNTHVTRLIPQGDAPAMFLFMVVKGTLAADGTVLSVELEKTYTSCRGPGETT